MRRRTLLQCFARNREGATAIEFALVAPVFLGAIFGMMYHGFVSLQLAHLDYTTFEAASALRIDTTPATNAAEFKTRIVCPAMSPILDCEDISVGVESSKNMADIGKWRKQNIIGKFCPGEAGDIILVSTEYRITDSFRFLYFGSGASDENALTLSSRYYLIREPTVVGETVAGC